jgi:hypothetical protein
MMHSTQNDSPPREVPRRWTDKRGLLASILLASVSVVVGCSPLFGSFERPADSAWQSVADGLGVQDWNGALEVALPDPVGDPRAGGALHLLVMNRSNTPIWFPLGYGTRAFRYDGDEGAWIELANEIEYLGEEDVLEPRESPSSNWAAAASIRPSVPQIKEEMILRLIAVGRVVEGGSVSAKSVGGYVDLHLPP